MSPRRETKELKILTGVVFMRTQICTWDMRVIKQGNKDRSAAAVISAKKTQFNLQGNPVLQIS